MLLHFAMRLAQDLPIPNGLTYPFEQATSETENTGYVSFVARFSEQGKMGAIIERLVFKRKRPVVLY